MEYGGARSVASKWPTVDRYNLCRQLALAVEYVHQENVVHGDIKGDNLLVDRDGTAKLADFGLAIVEDQGLRFSQTDPGGGTARWMASNVAGIWLSEAHVSCKAGAGVVWRKSPEVSRDGYIRGGNGK
ncbi:hypothetical protein FS749_006520 [Ceratobasidium sp. UAMH 11750]|nr:hypothetical protein FS749_006520 [Ceratobasidium sp. UAMH 11750]